jgi:hypothetical protein
MGISHSTQIWHMDTSKECADQVRIWLWFDDSWQLSLLNYEKKEIFSFRSLSPQWLYTFNSNMTYRYILGISSSSLNLVKVQWFWTKLSLLNVGKILNFEFQHSYFCENVCSHYFGYKYAICNLQTVNLNCV